MNTEHTFFSLIKNKGVFSFFDIVFDGANVQNKIDKVTNKPYVTL